ncbi:MAG: DHA2 family efflux MFS transporter permease subunit [Hyphomicrobiaceae bacterium]
MTSASGATAANRIVLWIVAAAVFMENMDSSVIATSLPAIAADLGEDPVILKLAFTSYLLSLAVFIPVSGWAADRFGARLIFRLAITVFMAGSIGCAMTGSLEGLIAARMVQGLGGAMMVPVGRLVVLKLVPKSEIVTAMALVTMPALVGPVIGPPLGGFITTYFHWRWIFWINIPVGLLGLVMATIWIPDIREEDTPKLDVVGFLLSGLGLSSLIFGFTVIGRHVLPETAVWAMMASGAVLMAVYVRHARRTAAPVLDLSLLAIPTFRSSILGGFLFRLGAGSIPFLLPLLLQLQFGLTPFESGLLTFVSAAAAIAMKMMAPPILKRFGFRDVLVWNALLSALILAATALFTAQTSHLVIFLVLLVGGFFRSLQFTSLNALAMADVSSRHLSRATSFTGVAQQLAVSIGVAVAAFALEIARGLRGETALTQADFAFAFITIGVIVALSAIVHWRLPANAGAELVGRGGG